MFLWFVLLLQVDNLVNVLSALFSQFYLGTYVVFVISILFWYQRLIFNATELGLSEEDAGGLFWYTMNYIYRTVRSIITIKISKAYCLYSLL